MDPIGTGSALIASVAEALSPFGLVVRGGFNPDIGDLVPEFSKGVGSGTLVLVGNTSSDMWQNFQDSESSRSASADCDDEPLDDWTKSVVDQVAQGLSARAVYPFEGPPYHPFLTWAMRADSVSQSPLGLTIHPAFGLWHAYRAALLFPEVVPISPPENAEPPCASCGHQRCLSACPVDAFGAGAYDVPRCLEHLSTAAGVRCLESGCLARHACPIGVESAYTPAQAEFHMKAFVRRVPSLI
jgi:hypothetical protein